MPKPGITVTDAIYLALRDTITGGKLEPGYRLREIPLSRHFGVSTTPVREALRRLEREGLVTLSPRRGAIVAVLNLRQIADLYEVREVLECRAVRRAAEALTRDLSRVETLLTEIALAIQDPDQVRFNHLDVEFHRALNDLSGNPMLAEFAERAHRQIQAVRVRCAVYLPGRPAISYAEHHRIVAAVRAGDAATAEALICAHIRAVRDAVVQVLHDTGRPG